MLHLHRAARADVLAHALADLLAEPPADPFAAELVAVPTRGMERWLAQTMSGILGARPGRGDGVCANVDFPTPHRLLSDAVASASGIDPERDPWRAERLVWPLLDVVGECLAEPWLAPLSRYLGGPRAGADPIRRDRRLSIVRHLAGLLDRYALHRPGMLASWASGQDVDASGQALPPDTAWQAELWRRTRRRVGAADPAERRTAACARLLADPGQLDLPARLAVFGLTRLPAGHLEVLRALAAARAVHLFLLHPSPSLWEAIAGAKAPASLRRADDSTTGLVRNRLLSSWGRDAREMQLVLGASRATDEIDEAHALLAPPGDPATLLARLQSDVQADRPAPGAPLAGQSDPRAALAEEDRSVTVHACHGRARQVEVLRDAILHALADDETLEPRDVIVMCPDIESFAPLIQATFGATASGEGSDAAIDLRVRLADRSLTQTNPVLGVVMALMELAGQRLTASQVIDLADRGPVRRRFGLDDDDLTRLGDWIAQAGIRWGFDGEHRAPYELAAVEAGTWRSGLDRLLLGVSMTEDEDRLFGDVLPLDDVDSRSIELAGRLAELVARLQVALDALSRSRPVSEWGSELAAAADALTSTGARERWQRAELQRILDAMIDESDGDGDGDGDPGSAPELSPTEARAHLEARLAGRPTRANFRTGHLTVCTLQPMRSVPHRVVCLLGLDDGAFPRKALRDGDDLMLHDPHLGERDPRSEDRQLLLDALLAAEDRLIVAYTGNDERTNTEVPPAVPIGELLDAIDATVRCSDGRTRPSAHVLVRHPLQPFDPRNYESAGLDGDGPWSFDSAGLGGARALSGERVDRPAFLGAPLTPIEERVLDLEDLIRFAESPIKSFLRRRLGIALRDGDDDPDDALPIELGGLEEWGVAQRLLEALLRGSSLRTAVRAEKARGTLPPDVLGDRVIDRVKQTVIDIATQADKLIAGAPPHDPIDVRVPLADGRLLVGTVSGVHGEALVWSSYSRVSARHRLATWVRLLALSAAHPDTPFAAATIGRAARGSDVRTCSIPPLADDPSARRQAALDALAPLVDLHDRGMREPLPIFPKSSAAWAEAASAGRSGAAAAGREWTSARFPREDAELAHQLVLGGAVTLDEVLSEPPRPEEAGAGWREEETTRLGRLARRLWDDLLEREAIETR